MKKTLLLIGPNEDEARVTPGSEAEKRFRALGYSEAWRVRQATDQTPSSMAASAVNFTAQVDTYDTVTVEPVDLSVAAAGAPTEKKRRGRPRKET